MRELLVTVLLLAACESADREAPRPPPVTGGAPLAPEPPAPKPPPPRVKHLTTRGEVVCEEPGICSRLARQWGDTLERYKSPTEASLDLLDGATPCKLTGATLTCGSSKETVYHHAGDGLGYVHGSKLQWIEWRGRDATPRLHTMSFPGGVVQLSLGLRLGCVLAGDGSTWCWSDPRAPRRMTMPPNVVEIAVQDPFELCVLAKSGDVSCTPPVQIDFLVCSTKSIHCGTGTVPDPVIHDRFDPLDKIARPLSRVRRGATRLVRDEDQIYEILMDHHIHVQARPLGACTLDAAGAVACLNPCKRGWQSYAVAMPPAQAVYGDRESLYAIATDGTLYAWERAECDAAAPVTAAKVAGMPPVSEVAPPMYLRVGPQTWDVVRCALGTDGATRCWTADRDGGLKRTVYDLAALSGRP